MAPPRSTESAIALPPAEAIAFLRQKTNTPSAHWDEVWHEAHTRGFAVAGATSQALLADFRAAVSKALEQGTTLAEFRKDFDRIVETHGWVHNGSPAWRSQIIYETNLSVAYSAGRYAQMTEPDTLRVYPFWQYQHTSSAHPRPQHLAWVGTTLRADDPWWATHYPPNGWRCRCSVRPVSAAGLKRQGKTGPDKAPPVDLRPWRNPRTGEIVEVPNGIDPGWGYNPGASWMGPPPAASGEPRPPVLPPTPAAPAEAPPIAPQPRLPRLPPAEAVPAPRAVPSTDLVKYLREPQGWATPGELAPEAMRLIVPEGAAAAPDVLLSAETAAKQLARHPELGAQGYAVELPELLRHPDAVLSTTSARTVMLLRRAADGRTFAAVVKAAAGGTELIMKTFHVLGPRDLRRLLRLRQLLLGSFDRWKDNGAPEGPPH